MKTNRLENLLHRNKKHGLLDLALTGVLLVGLVIAAALLTFHMPRMTAPPTGEVATGASAASPLTALAAADHEDETRPSLHAALR